MTTPEWTHPEADEDGFVPFELLKRQVAAMTFEEFLRKFPVPALLVVYREPEAMDEGARPSSSGIQLLTVSIKSRSVLRYLGKMAFITKRPGNPFAHLISVGRSAKNDITIAVDSVSKVHGYFVPGEQGWSFTDHGSTNGSVLNGEELRSGEKYPLENGAVLRLGLEVTLEIFDPPGLYRRAQEGG